MEQNNNQNIWYEKTWLVILLCIVFFPVGLYALWKNSNIGKGWKIGGTVIIAILVISAFGDDNDSSTSRNSSEETRPTDNNESTQKAWVELVSMTGNGDKKSNVFSYGGGNARLRYDFKAGDYGMFAAYVVKEGHDIMRDGGFPEVMFQGSEAGESNLGHLRKGNYYLNMTAANGNWTVVVEELK